MIRLGFGVLLAACAVLAGWMTRPSEQPYAEHIDVQDLPIVWIPEPTSTDVEPAAAFIERETVMEDGAVLVEGWLTVTDLPLSIEVTGPTPIRNAAGFSFLRSDLASIEGARAFSILLEPDSEKPVPICLTAVLGGDHQRLPTPSCP
jgi:hypothetical protein